MARLAIPGEQQEGPISEVMTNDELIFYISGTEMSRKWNEVFIADGEAAPNVERYRLR